MIQMTDAHGRPMLVDGAMVEPLPGSVVLTDGEHGTAWQRFFTDSLWHSTSGMRATWEDLLRRRRNVWLVHDATRRGK